MHDASFDTLVRKLRDGLVAPLPGLDAQRVMAPVPRAGWRASLARPKRARRAAVLLLMYPSDGAGPHLVLTRRAAHLPNHAGQIALPGGAVESGETIEESALREAHEEIGVLPGTVTILGQLTPLDVFVSGFVLHPVVAFTTPRPSFVPAPEEVARVIDVPLTVLADPYTIRLRRRVREGHHDDVPYFLVEGEMVWGATAMVLSEFLTVLGHPPSRPAEPTERDAP